MAVEGAASGVCADVGSSCSPPDPDWEFLEGNEDLGLTTRVDENGVRVIEGEDTVSGHRAKAAARSINKYWSGVSSEYNGAQYRSETGVRAVAEGGSVQILEIGRAELRARRKAAVKSALNCDKDSDLNWRSVHYGGNVPAVGKSTIHIGNPTSFRGTVAHEFGHVLGLGHAPRGSGSILSYDGDRAVLGRDLHNLYRGYSR